MNGLDQLKELKDEINGTDFSDVLNDIDILEKWVLTLSDAIDDLDEVAELLESKDDKITELQNQVDELEEGVFLEDNEETIIEVDTLLDQMKVQHLREVFHDYTLDEIESLLPKK